MKFDLRFGEGDFTAEDAEGAEEGAERMCPQIAQMTQINTGTRQVAALRGADFSFVLIFSVSLCLSGYVFFFFKSSIINLKSSM